MSEAYEKRTYGGRDVGFGKTPAIAVVDFQRGYIDEQFDMGGSTLVNSAVEHSAKLLTLARSKNIPVATCAMAFQSEATWSIHTDDDEEAERWMGEDGRVMWEVPAVEGFTVDDAFAREQMQNAR